MASTVQALRSTRFHEVVAHEQS